MHPTQHVSQRDPLSSPASNPFRIPTVAIQNLVAQAVKRAPITNKENIIPIATTLLEHGLKSGFLLDPNSTVKAISNIPPSQRQRISELSLPLITDSRITELLQALSHLPEDERQEILAQSAPLLTKITDGTSKALILKAVGQIPSHEREAILKLAAPLLSDITNAQAIIEILAAIHKTPAQKRTALIELIQPLLHEVSIGQAKAEIVKAVSQIPFGEQAAVLEHAAPLLVGVTDGHAKALIIKTIRHIPLNTRAAVLEDAAPLLISVTSGFTKAEILMAVSQIHSVGRKKLIKQVRPLLLDIPAGYIKAQIIKAVSTIALDEREKILSALPKKLDPEILAAILQIVSLSPPGTCFATLKALFAWLTPKTKTYLQHHELKLLEQVQKIAPSIRLHILELYSHLLIHTPTQSDKIHLLQAVELIFSNEHEIAIQKPKEFSITPDVNGEPDQQIAQNPHQKNEFIQKLEAIIQQNPRNVNYLFSRGHSELSALPAVQPQQFFVDRQELKDNPFSILHQLVKRLESKQYDTIKVKFRGDPIQLVSTKSFIPLLFDTLKTKLSFSTCKSGLYKPELIEQDEHRRVYTELGTLMMFCYITEGKYPIGKIFDLGVFAALQKLLLSDSFDSCYEAFKLLQEDQKETLDRIDALLQPLDDQKSDKDLLDFLTLVEADDQVKALSLGADTAKIRSHYVILQQAMKRAITKRVEPLVAMANGIKGHDESWRQVQMMEPKEAFKMLQGVDPVTAPLASQARAPFSNHQEIRAAVNHKYLGLRALPQQPVPQGNGVLNSPNSLVKHTVTFSDLLQNSQGTAKPKIGFDYTFTEGSQLSFYTCNQTPIEPDSQCVFVFCGRKEHAMLPVSQSIRVIAVMTESEYQAFGKLPDSIDVLVIKKLHSLTHGNYSDKLALINSRRIAAFLFAHQKKLATMMVMDDNLKNINLNRDCSGDDPMQKVYLYLREKLQTTACVSVATHLHTKEKGHTLGSKLFMYDLAAINMKMNEPDELFHLCYAANQGNYWGQDYFIQLVLRQLFKNEKLGHLVANTDEITLTRSAKHRNVTKACAVKAQEHLEPIELSARPHYKEIVTSAHRDLCKIIQDSLSWRQKAEQTLTKMNMCSQHAFANRLPYVNPQLKVQVSPDFKDAITKYLESGPELYDHQKCAIEKVAENLETTGYVTMATGTGKTRVQMALAHKMLLTDPKKPVFVVLPTRNLLKQAYTEFLAYFEAHAQDGLNGCSVLKVSSSKSDIHAPALEYNKTLSDKNVVMLFCAESYNHFLSNSYFEPSLLLLDEYDAEEFGSTLANMISKNRSKRVFGFSATPLKFNPFRREIYRYSRQQALDDGIIVPIIMDKRKESYSLDEVDVVIDNLHNWLKYSIDSNGRPFCENKGIVYLPDSSYCELAKQKLLNHGYPENEIYIIHSNNSTYKDDLERFKNAPKAVAFAIRMMRVGYDDTKVKWIVIAKKADDDGLLAQMAGRVMRRDREEPKKVGYIQTFADANTDYFESWIDKEALEKAEPLFLKSYGAWDQIVTLSEKECSCDSALKFADLVQIKPERPPLLWYAIFASGKTKNQDLFKQLRYRKAKISIECLRAPGEGNCSSLWMLAQEKTANAAKLFTHFYDKLTIEDLRNKPDGDDRTVLYFLITKAANGDTQALDTIMRLAKEITPDDLQKRYGKSKKRTITELLEIAATYADKNKLDTVGEKCRLVKQLLLLKLKRA